MQPVVIKRSRTAVVLAVWMSGLVAIVFWAFSLGLLVFYTAFSFEAQIMVSIASGGGAWIALVCHFSPTKPALIIDDRGIVDQASPYEVGLIPWSEIRGAEIVRRSGGSGSQKFLAISVRDLAVFTARVGFIARTMMRLGQLLSGTVIDIPQWSLRPPVEEVLAVLLQHGPGLGMPPQRLQ